MLRAVGVVHRLVAHFDAASRAEIFLSGLGIGFDALQQLLADVDHDCAHTLSAGDSFMGGDRDQRQGGGLAQEESYSDSEVSLIVKVPLVRT